MRDTLVSDGLPIDGSVAHPIVALRHAIVANPSLAIGHSRIGLVTAICTHLPNFGAMRLLAFGRPQSPIYLSIAALDALLTLIARLHPLATLRSVGPHRHPSIAP